MWRFIEWGFNIGKIDIWFSDSWYWDFSYLKYGAIYLGYLNIDWSEICQNS